MNSTKLQKINNTPHKEAILSYSNAKLLKYDNTLHNNILNITDCQITKI